MTVNRYDRRWKAAVGASAAGLIYLAAMAAIIGAVILAARLHPAGLAIAGLLGVLVLGWWVLYDARRPR